MFVGQHPKNNFASILSRFKGATPTHFKGGGGHTSMMFTPRENDMDAQIKVEERIDPRTTSLFVSQFLTDYRFATHTVNVLISKLNLRIPRDAFDRTKILALFGHHEKYVKSVTQLQKLLLEEFTGRLPIAQPNCFKVHKLVMEFRKNLAEQYCAPDRSGIPEEFAIPKGPHIPKTWSESKQALLPLDYNAGMSYHVYGAMHVSRMAKMGKKKVYWEQYASVRTMRDAILNVWSGKTSDEFVWNYV
jgi:hypothetical protein